MHLQIYSKIRIACGRFPTRSAAAFVSYNLIKNGIGMTVIPIEP